MTKTSFFQYEVRLKTIAQTLLKGRKRRWIFQVLYLLHKFDFTDSLSYYVNNRVLLHERNCYLHVRLFQDRWLGDELSDPKRNTKAEMYKRSVSHFNRLQSIF